MNRNALAALAAALALATLPATAKDGTETRAREQFRAGQVAFAKGDYEQALSAFSAAYGLQPIPGLLFDIAQCHRKLGNDERAAVFYQQYLELSPSTENASTVRALLNEIQMSEKERKRRLADDGTVRRAILESSEKTSSLDATLAPKKPTSDLVRSTASKDSIFQKWWFWTGAGAIALGTTTFILASHNSSTPGSVPGQLQTR